MKQEQIQGCIAVSDIDFVRMQKEIEKLGCFYSNLGLERLYSLATAQFQTVEEAKEICSLMPVDSDRFKAPWTKWNELHAELLAKADSYTLALDAVTTLPAVCYEGNGYIKVLYDAELAAEAILKAVRLAANFGQAVKVIAEAECRKVADSRCCPIEVLKILQKLAVTIADHEIVLSKINTTLKQTASDAALLDEMHRVSSQEILRIFGGSTADMPLLHALAQVDTLSYGIRGLAFGHLLVSRTYTIDEILIFLGYIRKENFKQVYADAVSLLYKAVKAQLAEEQPDLKATYALLRKYRDIGSVADLLRVRAETLLMKSFEEATDFQHYLSIFRQSSSPEMRVLCWNKMLPLIENAEQVFGLWQASYHTLSDEGKDLLITLWLEKAGSDKNRLQIALDFTHSLKVFEKVLSLASSFEDALCLFKAQEHTTKQGFRKPAFEKLLQCTSNLSQGMELLCMYNSDKCHPEEQRQICLRLMELVNTKEELLRIRRVAKYWDTDTNLTFVTRLAPFFLKAEPASTEKKEEVRG